MPRLYQWLAAIFVCFALLGPSVGARAGDDPSVVASADPVTNEYHLGAGDKVRVIVFGETELTGEFFVGGAGDVSLPLIGDVHAAGLTVSQLQTAITTALQQGFLKDPKVSIEVLTYRPFYILGEVNKPGEYPYTHGLTVLNAVATAGGFTYRANTKEVAIRRANEKAEHKEPLTTTTSVAPGDTIRISERFF
jgi:protein involved in polysaccharide export with SLBB domain